MTTLRSFSNLLVTPTLKGNLCGSINELLPIAARDKSVGHGSILMPWLQDQRTLSRSPDHDLVLSSTVRYWVVWFLPPTMQEYNKNNNTLK